MADIIQHLFNVPLCPELADIIVSNLDKIDYTMLYFVDKKMQPITKHKLCRKYNMANKSAKYGYLNILKWARKNGCRWNKWTCVYAAKNGHLEVLKWLEENDCFWNKRAFKVATKRGHHIVAQWLKENDFWWSLSLPTM
jgi:hypothetical protein